MTSGKLLLTSGDLIEFGETITLTAADGTVSTITQEDADAMIAADPVVSVMLQDVARLTEE